NPTRRSPTAVLAERGAQPVDERGLGDDAELIAQPIDARAGLQDFPGPRGRVRDLRRPPTQLDDAARELGDRDLAAGADVRDQPAVAIGERRDDPADDVADVDEVARLLAVAEDRERA